jgi:AcrR family transcriptional regulator
MGEPESAAPRPRVPQQERSRATQARILDAAVRVLTESGYEGFTTAVVSQRAEVSKGALFKHFPARETLLVATVLHLFERQRGRFASALMRLEGQNVRERVRAAIRALWDLLRDPEYLAVLQVYGAARTNAKLASALGPIAEEEAAGTHAAGTLLFTSFGVPPDADVGGLIAIVFYALEGMAQDEGFNGEPTPGYYEQAFRQLERLVMDLIPEEE